MDLPIPDLESVYGIRPRSVIKSKYFYIISSGGALYRLYSFAQGAESAGRIYILAKKLAAHGVAVCPLVPTLDGQPYSAAEDELFILTAVPKGRDADLERDFGKMLALMGRFHRVLKNESAGDIDCILPYKKGIKALLHIHSMLNRKNKLSEIDKMFNENFSRVYALASGAVDTLQKCSLIPTYAYGTPKEENFIISPDGSLTLTNWNSLKVSHFLNDTAYMLKRYSKKCPDAHMSPQAAFACYIRENPLTSAEQTALDSIMDYPEKYIAIVREYYGKHRPFAPLYVKEKLAKELKNMR